MVWLENVYGIDYLFFYVLYRYSCPFVSFIILCLIFIYIIATIQYYNIDTGGQFGTALPSFFLDIETLN
jgi:hypothetical protein